MISVSRPPVLAAVLFNVDSRIPFLTTPQAMKPVTPLILRSCGSTASGPGGVPPYILHPPRLHLGFLYEGIIGFPCYAMVFFLVGAPVF
jgi:hypothetical protein